jgi:GntR family transcriptional regulator/MocR family aminotransferase
LTVVEDHPDLETYGGLGIVDSTISSANRQTKPGHPMQLFVSDDDRRSLSGQLYEQLRDAITEGRLAPGTRLTPSRAVAAELAIARSTVTEAYGRLTAEGYVEGHRGSGSFVAAQDVPPARRSPPTSLEPTAEASAIRRYGHPETTPTASYDLRAGHLDGRLFPTGRWQRCANRAMRDVVDDLGRYVDPAGGAELRRALAAWVSRSRGVAASPDQVVFTHGAAHAVDLVARTLLRPGDVAAVEEPGYPPVTALLRTFGIDVVGVPVDEEGLVVDALPAAARLVHVTPSHQYPLGVVLTRSRRLALLDWARRHDVAVIEDDYDSEFRYGRPLEPLQALDRDGRVVYVGTFSKMLSPALRAGFAVLPAGLVPAAIAVRQAIDSGPSAFLTATLAHFLHRGELDRHLRRMRRLYADRRRVLLSELAGPSGRGLTPLPGKAGVHLAVLAPDVPDDTTLAAQALRRGLLISSLRLTYQFTEGRGGVVLGFGAIATEDIPPAVTLLGETLHNP